MKRILLSLLATLLIIPFVSADFPDYYNKPNEPFHPRNNDYYNSDNEWLKLKKRADIERASQPAVHFDDEANDYFRCDWNYNKNLATWVCDKKGIEGRGSSTFSNPTPIPICPYGQQLNPWKTGCNKVNIPTNGVLNQQGNGWDCKEGYRLNSAQTGCVSNITYIYEPAIVNAEPIETVKYVYVNEAPKPSRLPSTGSSLPLTELSMLALLALKRFR